MGVSNVTFASKASGLGAFAIGRQNTDMADDFKPGLEGVIAFESEIAEPDKEGSALRYRGVDIDDLVEIGRAHV